MAFLIGGANSATGGYEITNSCRFDEASSAEMTFTPSSDGTKTKWTISFWFKRGVIDGTRRVFFGSVDDYLRITDDETIQFFITDNGGTGRSFYSPAKIRDPSAWYHVVATWDSTQGTAANRQRVFLNGEALTPNSFTAASQNATSASINNGSAVHNIGGELNPANDDHWDGYISELYFIDGTGYTASTFGETNDDGVWVPIKASPTFGSNGFFMEFKGTGTSADSSGIGADTSGKDNHFAVSNLAATDVTTDTPTNNFCTMSSIDTNTQASLSEGNTQLQRGSNYAGCNGTFGVANGKWYWEIKTPSPTTSGENSSFGVTSIPHATIGNNYLATSGTTEWAIMIDNASSDIYKIHNNSTSDYGVNASSNDIFQIALDMDNNKIYFGRNGTFLASGDPAGNSNEAYASVSGDSFLFPAFSMNGNDTLQANFGNAPFSISSGNADGNGYGNFEFAVPSGYFALCTKNLAEYG